MTGDRFVWMAVVAMAVASVAVSKAADAAGTADVTALSGLGAEGTWIGAEEKAGAVEVALDLGTERVNWNHARWAVHEFAKPVDLSAYDALVVAVETDRPRTDAWVDVALMENDGSWYYVRDACPLSTRSRTATVPLAAMRPAEFVFNELGTASGTSGNFDEDFSLDLGSVARLAIGTVNPHGVGEVAFRVRSVGFRRTSPTDPTEPAAATVTGRLLAVNGADEVPPGLFGFHWVGGDAARVKELRVGSLRPHKAMGFGGSFLQPPEPANHVYLTVSCQYDRRNQLPQASRGDWKELARKLGRDLGEKGKPYGDAVAIEWWNEPYLELGRRLPGNLRVKPPEGARPGDPVVTNYGRRLESMVWTGEKNAATGEVRLRPKDPTRFTYWSGRQVATFYVETFNEMAKEAKRVAPQMRLVGGMGFRWQEDDWAAWDLLHKPIVDECIEHLDGVNEHHYQGCTEAVPAAYEVLNAYTVSKHGKPMPCYSTETNDLWDVPARGRPAAEFQKGTFRSRRRAIYNLRDILLLVKETPDKAVSRAIHALWKGGQFGDDGPWGPMGIEQGEYVALKFLADLRGKLVEARCPDEDVWVVSSLDADAGRLVTILFNNGPEVRQYALEVEAPAGTTFDGAERVELVHDGTGLVGLVEADAADAEGRSYNRTGYLGPAFASKTVLKLKGTPPAGPQVVRRQAFCGAPDASRDAILHELKPGETVTMPVRFEGKLGRPKRAWLRLVVERLGEGEGYVDLAGKRFVIPAAYTPFNTPLLRQIEIDPKLLADEVRLTFGANRPEAGDGYLLAMGSLVVEE